MARNEKGKTTTRTTINNKSFLAWLGKRLSKVVLVVVKKRKRQQGQHKTTRNNKKVSSHGSEKKVVQCCHGCRKNTARYVIAHFNDLKVLKDLKARRGK